MRFKVITVACLAALSIAFCVSFAGCKSKSKEVTAPKTHFDEFIWGTLSFKEGENELPGTTYDVGRPGKRRFLRGDSESQAVWTFSNLNSTDPPNIAFIFDVFRTVPGDVDRGILCSLTFRNPLTHYRTKAGFLSVSSIEVQQFDSWDKLNDIAGKPVSLPLLLQEGKLEVIFKCHQPDQLVGVYPSDLVIVPDGVAIEKAITESHKEFMKDDNVSTKEENSAAGFLKAAGAKDECLSSLRRLAVAMFDFQQLHRSLPMPANYNANGKPLLSWRVHLLPFLGHQELYAQFHLDEPWDSQHNRSLIPRMPGVFAGPNDVADDPEEKTKTAFLAVSGPGTMFEGNTQLSFRDARDGSANTIAFALASPQNATVWTRPEDLTVQLNRPKAGLANIDGKFLVAFLDGNADTINATIDDVVLLTMLLRDDVATRPPGY